jgi:hypothetical protein
MAFLLPILGAGVSAFVGGYGLHSMEQDEVIRTANMDKISDNIDKLREMQRGQDPVGLARAHFVNNNNKFVNQLGRSNRNVANLNAGINDLIGMYNTSFAGMLKTDGSRIETLEEEEEIIVDDLSKYKLSTDTGNSKATHNSATYNYYGTMGPSSEETPAVPTPEYIYIRDSQPATNSGGSSFMDSFPMLMMMMFMMSNFQGRVQQGQPTNEFPPGYY